MDNEGSNSQQDFHGGNSRCLSVLKAAFPATLPVFAGFWFLGLAYGIYMHSLGFPFWYPMCMSALIFAGSLEFVIANMLSGAFAPLQVLLISLLVNARHVFYGIAMLDRFRGLGFWRKTALIAGMCDETFAINYSAKVPQGVDKGSFMLAVTLFNYSYWVSGATLGGLFGNALSFNTRGLEFVLTAMFTVIFTQQWLKDRSRIPELTGFGCAFLCLLCLGPQNFMVPAMLLITLMLAFLRKPLSGRL
jgi:4-azaleucine resistance transporter AzlC